MTRPIILVRDGLAEPAIAPTPAPITIVSALPAYLATNVILNFMDKTVFLIIKRRRSVARKRNVYIVLPATKWIASTPIDVIKRIATVVDWR